MAKKGILLIGGQKLSWDMRIIHFTTGLLISFVGKTDDAQKGFL
jgi:hypothetical protein